MEHDAIVKDDKNRLISMSQASELYGFDNRYLTKLAKKGRLQAQKIGYMWLTTPAHMDKYIASRKRMGAYRNDIKPQSN